MAHDGCNCYFSFWAISLPFYPPNNLKNENLKKMKKTPGDIIILHNCTKNHDHMLYCSRVLASKQPVNSLFPIESYNFFPNQVSPTDKTTCVKVDSKHFSIISPVN